jgi:hypothetical protein
VVKRAAFRVPVTCLVDSAAQLRARLKLTKGLR